MPPAGFEPTIPASEQPQTQALNRAATGIGEVISWSIIIIIIANFVIFQLFVTPAFYGQENDLLTSTKTGRSYDLFLNVTRTATTG
jgi:hypothetical protein